MKKRIFAGFLTLMVILCSLATCFAAGEGEALVIKNPNYDDKTNLLSFSVANVSDKELVFAISGLDYDEKIVQLGHFQKEVSAMPIAAGSEVKVTIPLSVLNYKAAGLPKIGISLQYADNSMTALDLSTAVDIGEITIENIFSEGTTAGEAVLNFLKQTGFMSVVNNPKVLLMLLISFVLMYLAIAKGFEPLLLLPIAFGMLLTNLPGAEMFHEELLADGHVHWDLFNATNSIAPGLIDYLYLGVKLGIYPCLIFLGVGAMTDFGPLIANPKSLLLGAAAQLGIFITFIAARLLGFTPAEAASTGIIGGADGPTAIFVTTKLAPHLLGPIAVAAYSYMALVPVIQPPIMKALTTKKERQIVMKPLREVSKVEKIVFPIAITVFVTLLVPSAGPLIGALMLGNLARECGVVDRLSKTAQNELMNIVTIFLGLSVGATATADTFLAPKTLAIIFMGVVAFGMGTAGGVLLAKFMNLFTKKNKINPLIGSAGVSAVPMAARVSQVVGQKENPQNFLLMHAMGPNVAGVIGSAIAAGVLIALFG